MTYSDYLITTCTNLYELCHAHQVYELYELNEVYEPNEVYKWH